MLAQTTQPAHWILSPEVTMAITGGLVVIIGAIVAMLVKWIGRIGAKADAAGQTAAVANAKADANDQRLTRTNARVDTALVNTPPPGTGTGGGNLPPAVMVLLPFLLLFAVGCSEMSTGERILTGRQTNALAMKVVNDLAESGLIRDPVIVDAAVELSEEATAGFDDAQAEWLKGNTVNAEFILRRARSALDRLLKIQLKHQTPVPVSAGERPPCPLLSQSPSPPWASPNVCFKSSRTVRPASPPILKMTHFSPNWQTRALLKLLNRSAVA